MSFAMEWPQKLFKASFEVFIIAMYYLKIMIILKKKICEKKSFNQTIRSLFEKMLRKWGSIINRRLHLGPNWLS